MNASTVSGPLKAAVLLRNLDPVTARDLTEGLTDLERRILEAKAAEADRLSPELARSVLEEFYSLMGIETESTSGGSHGFAGGESFAGGGSFGSNRSMGGGLARLQAKDPEELASLIREEHPQTVAIVLAQLPPQKAGAVLESLPEETRTEVAVRIATSGKYAGEMVEEMETVFEEILRQKETAPSGDPGGAERLAEILNQLDKAAVRSVMGEIERMDEVLAARIKQMMFVFDDVVLVDDRGFQDVLRRVETRDLAVALKAASEEIRDKVFRNLSARAGDMLREEMDNLGPVRMKDVEAAQQLILGQIQEMEAQGNLVIRRGGGDEYVE
ncbi:MAG: flagellar motor switch protein FliG [Desulfococcaceae bacterium]